jgi:hypothetical protein
VPSFRSSGSFGKRQEYIAVAELLRHGYDVYMTLVDDQQIDCVVRLEVDSHPVYIDVQIKARSARVKQAGTFAALAVRDPRPNFMFVFYPVGAGAYWVMPSLDLIEEATRNKEGVNAGKYSIVFTNTRKDESRIRALGSTLGETTGKHSMSWHVVSRPHAPAESLDLAVGAARYMIEGATHTA